MNTRTGRQADRPRPHARLSKATHAPKDKDEPGERGVRGDSLQPVVIQVEQQHLRLRGFEDQIPKLLNLQRSLKGQLQFTPRYDNVWKIQKMHL